MKLFGNATLKCSPLDLEYDFEDLSGTLTVPTGQIPDMRGAIEQFEIFGPINHIVVIDPQGEVQVTYHFRHSDGEWVAW